MKFTLFLLLALGMVSLAMGRSAFLDDLFDSSSSSSKIALAFSCNATDTCAGKEDACVGNYNAGVNSNACSKTNGTCCADGLYCINKTCQVNNYNAACSSNSDCMPGNELVCSNKTCQYLMNIGDPCSANDVCVSGTCTNGTCMGVAYGGSCMTSFQCDFGLYCPIGINSTCSNSTAVGGACTSSMQCVGGSVCYYSSFSNTTMTCQGFGTQDAGEPCAGLMCSSGLSCQGGSAGNQTCISVNTSSQACTADANCTNAMCWCSAVTGSGFCVGYTYNMPCTDEELSLQSCLDQNMCFGASEAPDSCCQNNCESEYKKSFSCSCSLANSILGKCFYNDNCGGFPVWAIIVIIVVAIVLVLAIVLLVFFMMRRRRQYDSI